MDQAALTIVAPIEGELLPLGDLLDSIESEVRAGALGQGALLPFGDLETVHFARFAILTPPPPPPDGPPPARRDAPPLLLFTTNYDGPRDAHLRELMSVAGPGLKRVFAHCSKNLEGATGDELRAFLEAHSVGCEAFYVGHRGRSVGQIRAERDLHRELSDDVLGPSSGRLSSEPFEDAQRHVRENGRLEWVFSDTAPTRLAWYARALLLGAFALGALALSPVLIVWLLCIRARERREERELPVDVVPELVDARDRSIEHKSALVHDEDRGVHNQMTLVTDVKPEFLRLLTLRAVLRAVDFLGRTWWDKGSLGDIQSIHFARWFLVEQGGLRRLVFCSNYDGSWETYLGSFIDGAAKGLTGIWSNTVGFPRSRWLIWSGARRELKFKRWVRNHQVETQVFYSAYPDLSVTNVQNNSVLRSGLRGLRKLEERQAWLRLV